MVVRGENTSTKRYTSGACMTQEQEANNAKDANQTSRKEL